MSPAPRSIVRAIFHPLYERLRGRSTGRHYRAMLANDRMDADALQELHDRMLVEHLKRAAETVPWYRERVDAGAVRSAEDLARFPLLDKATITEAGDHLCSEAWKGRLTRLETGGSSGEPLSFLSELERESSQLACKLRARAWFGLHPGHRETDLWGSPLEAAKHDRLRRAVSGVMGYQLLPAFRLNDQSMEDFRKQLAGGRADFLYGYASAFARYARFLEARGEDLQELGLALCICTAETLLPADRELITQRIAPVANEYGCRDGGLVAHEDPAGHLRLMWDAVHVEIVDEALEPVEPGEEGEVVITNLWARGFPMIRYRLGDRAVRAPGPPPAGLPHPVLKSLLGRTTDFLIALDGSRVHALGVIYVMREIAGVARFRVVQESRELVRVLVVAGPGLDREALPGVVQAKVCAVLGAGMDVCTEIVDDLEPLPSGKHRYIICDVPDSP